MGTYTFCEGLILGILCEDLRGTLTFLKDSRETTRADN